MLFKKIILKILFIILVIITIFFLYQKYILPTPTIIRGEVLENNQGCAIDLGCYLNMKANGIKYSFGYDNGLLFNKKTNKLIPAQNCLTKDENEIVWNLEVGQKIELKAWIIKDFLFYKELGTCPEGTSWIKIIE